jgi:chemotaxis protein MotB
LKRALFAAAALALAGCVTPEQYRAAVDERDALKERIQQQEASVQALTAERDRLAGELEDLRVASEPLARDAEKLHGIEARLPACETELADKTAKLDQLQTTYEGLVRDLEAEVASSNTKIDQLREGLRMSLPAEVLFTSGSADLSDEGTRVLADLGKDLRAEKYASYQILVEGHTDGVAIRGPLAERYATNWELAGARAARVVRALEEAGVDGTRLAAVSRGAKHPVAADDSPEGRAANRRIEIRLIPSATVTAPAPAPNAAAPAPPAKPANPAPPAQ